MTTPPESLFLRTSDIQRVALYRESDGSLSMTLDDFWQFSTLDEHVFHEVLVDAALVEAPSIRRVLILGGGDGLALRNVLRYAEVESATLVEIDDVVLEMTRTVPEMQRLTGLSLDDPRAHIICDDALAYLPTCTEPFDVVICDFPVDRIGNTSPSFDGGFLSTVASCVAPKGVVTMQVSQDPLAFWPVLEAVQQTFEHTAPRLAKLATYMWANFVTASRVKLERRRPLSDAARFLSEHSPDALRIRNVGDGWFETGAYGRDPDYAEPDDGIA